MSEAKEVAVYSSLAALARASDLVVEGTVTAVRRGRIVGTEEPLQFREVTLRIDKRLSRKTVPDEVVFEEAGWDSGRNQSL